jgi:hypothetical protein
MIMPTKHTTFSESLLGLGSFILQSLRETPMTFEQLWQTFSEAKKNKVYNFPHDIENFSLALLLLYSLGLIKEEQNGGIILCD